MPSLVQFEKLFDPMKKKLFLIFLIRETQKVPYEMRMKG